MGPKTRDSDFSRDEKPKSIMFTVQYVHMIDIDEQISQGFGRIKLHKK